MWFYLDGLKKRHIKIQKAAAGSLVGVCGAVRYQVPHLKDTSVVASKA